MERTSSYLEKNPQLLMHSFCLIFGKNEIWGLGTIHSYIVLYQTHRPESIKLKVKKFIPLMSFVQIFVCLQKIGVLPWSTPSGGFTKRAKVLQKNAWLGHYPKGSTVSNIGSYLLEELFPFFFISNE